MEQIGTYYMKTERKFADFEVRIEESEERIKHHFDIVAEDMRHDYLGIYKDRTEGYTQKLQSHEKRITHLERQAA